MDLMSQVPTWKFGRIPAFENYGIYGFLLVCTGFSYKVGSAGDFFQLVLASPIAIPH